MTDYRLVMSLLLQGRSYRQIEAIAGCSHRTIARARKVIDDHQLTSLNQVQGLSTQRLDELFADGRKTGSELFVDFDVAQVVAARTGRKKPTLRVLWATYLDTPATGGRGHYSYERFRQIVADYVDTHDLTMRIAHVPGHTMQVDWAGTTMPLIIPGTQQVRKVHLFVASLPYSGMVFCRGYLDEKMPSWLDAHRRAFEYFDGVAQVIVPDNASTASNAISRHDRARDVNRSYADFLEYYATAAVPTRARKPKDKGNVEAGVQVITQWVIHRLADHQFHDLDDLNTAITRQVEEINTRTPFRGEQISRKELFTQAEHPELTALPPSPWQPVTWRKAKVHRDWHIQIDTVKYSVPFTFVGKHVDVRITGTEVAIMCDHQIIATHTLANARHVFVTDTDHAPMDHDAVTGLWSREYFLRQAAKIGPATVQALTDLLDSKTIEAQGFRSCMNIVSLGKGTNRAVLEQACSQLIDPNARRAVSYTAIKNQMAAVRALQAARPTTTPAHDGDTTVPAARDTSSAHLAGAEQFSLHALRAARTTTSDTTTHPQ